MATVLLLADTLAVLFEHLGLRHVSVAACTCSAWAAAAELTVSGWRILSPSRVLGGVRGVAPG
eukprot:7334027-Prymnesium_polylepis.1